MTVKNHVHRILRQIRAPGRAGRYGPSQPSPPGADEGFSLITSSIAKSLDPAEAGGVGLDQVEIELMLSDHLAESIADHTPAVVPVADGRLRNDRRLGDRVCFLFKRGGLKDGRLDLSGHQLIGSYLAFLEGVRFAEQDLQYSRQGRA